MTNATKTILGLALVAAFAVTFAWAQTSDSTDFTDVFVSDDLFVTDDATISGDLAVTGDLTLTAQLTADEYIVTGAMVTPTLAGYASFGNDGITFEGATADAFEWTVTVGDPAAASSMTLEAAGGILMGAGTVNADPTTANFYAMGSTGFVFEGATLDAFETSILVIDPAADSSLTIEAAGGLLMGAGTVNADPTTASFWAGGSTGFVFEGATVDANEWTFTVTDASADNVLLFEPAGGLLFSAGVLNADPGTASYYSIGSTGIVYEGATNDAFETTITITDPTVDNTLIVGATGGLTISRTSGFNGNTGTQFNGIGLGAQDYVVGTAGRTEAQTVREDGETAATWDEVTCGGGANTCVAVPSTDDAVNFKFGATAQSITTATMVATDTIGMAAFGAEDFDALENVGIWMRADATTVGTDWDFQLVDDGGTRSFDLEAITVADQWQFVEVDLTGGATCGAGDCDSVTQLLIECDANCDGITFKIDNLYIWDTADETALNHDILDQPGAVGSAWSQVTADGGAQTHARTLMVHCDTIAGSATDFVIDPDDNTMISVDDNSTLTAHLFYHRAAF